MIERAAGDRVHLFKEDDQYWKLSTGAPNDRAPPKPTATRRKMTAEIASSNMGPARIGFLRCVAGIVFVGGTLIQMFVLNCFPEGGYSPEVMELWRGILIIVAAPLTACAALFLHSTNLIERRSLIDWWRAALDNIKGAAAGNAYVLIVKHCEATYIRDRHISNLRDLSVFLWSVLAGVGCFFGPSFCELVFLPTANPAHNLAWSAITNPALVASALATCLLWSQFGYLIAEALWHLNPPLAQTQAVVSPKSLSSGH